MRPPSIPTRDREAAARLSESVRAKVAATPAATLRTAHRTRIGIGIVCAATLLTIIASSQLVYGRWAAGVSVAIDSRVGAVQMGGLVLLLATAATIVAVWRGRAGFGLPQAILAALAALVAPIYAILTVLLPQHVPSINLIVSPWGSRCLLIAALVGLIALVAFAWALHRAVPEPVASRAWAIGACAGAWAGVAVFFFCPSVDQQHLLLGHVLPIALLTILGPMFLPRTLRP